MVTVVAFTCLKNAVHFVEAWYENVQQADHIVIQDGGSTDGTRELLVKWANENPKVTLLLQSEPWEKYKWDEQRVRNQCLGLYHNFLQDFDWVLYTDCDELVSDNFWKWFREADHRKNGNEIIGYYISHRNLWCRRDMFRMDGPWYPDLTLRLFKNHRGLIWVGAEHGSLWRMNGMCRPEDNDMAIAGQADNEDIYLVHYHRWEEGYGPAVLEDRTEHHSNEQDNFRYLIDPYVPRPVLAPLKQHPTGAGLIRKRFEE